MSPDHLVDFGAAFGRHQTSAALRSGRSPPALSRQPGRVMPNVLPPPRFVLSSPRSAEAACDVPPYGFEGDLLPQARRVPAARCAGWLQAQAPGPNTAARFSSTGRASATTSRARRGASANPCFVALTPGEPLKRRAKPPHFESQPRAMRFVGELRPECPRDEGAPRRLRSR
jgi:hypothetical protein